MTTTSTVKTARTYRLTENLVEQIDQLAQQNGVYQSDIVEMLLTKALAEVSAQRWWIKREPVKYRVKIE